MRQRYHAFAPALALDQYHAIFRAQYIAGERNQFRNTQTSGIQDFQQAMGAQSAQPLLAVHIRCPFAHPVEQCIDIFNGQYFWQGTQLLGAIDGRRRIIRTHAFSMQKAKKLAHSRKLAGLAGSCEPAGRDVVQEDADVGRLSIASTEPSDFQLIGKFVQVACVGGERVGRSAALGTQHLEKLFDIVIGLARGGHRLFHFVRSAARLSARDCITCAP